MKTTLNIDDTVMRRLRRAAARDGRTMGEMVEAALRLLLDAEERQPTEELPPLPTFSAEPLIDVADRDALDAAMTD